jgi:hypothetical protein
MKQRQLRYFLQCLRRRQVTHHSVHSSSTSAMVLPETKILLWWLVETARPSQSGVRDWELSEYVQHRELSWYDQQRPSHQ